MIIYWVSFFCSVFFLLFGLRSQKIIIGKIFIVVGLIIPCLLAGMRDISIGSDTSGYVFDLFKRISSATSINDAIKSGKIIRSK